MGFEILGREWWVWAVDILGMTPGFAIGWPYFKSWLNPKIDSWSGSPATLDSFNITYCTEGTVVPLIYGTVRVPGNLLWYGNFVSQGNVIPGPGQPIDGYNYWMDLWQGIGVGPLEIIGMYSNDKEILFTNTYTYTPGSAPSFGITRLFGLTDGGTTRYSAIYNPGDCAYVPAPPGENAAASSHRL